MVQTIIVSGPLSGGQITIERQLAHVDTNQVRRAYARGEYWDERVQMMQSWSDYLDELREGGKILRPTFPTARRAV